MYKNPELEQVIIQYLTLMERLSVGLNTEVYDLNVYARICSGKTISTWNQLEAIINDKRKKSGNTSLYKEFEDVVEKLKNWRSKPPVETRGDYNGLKS